jgi:osmotically inducible protein OsmC
MKRTASAQWQGNLVQGSGTISTESMVLNNSAFSFGTRFEKQAGTNPEELIGAALAACYSMALSAALSEAGYDIKYIKTKAYVNFEKLENKWTITTIILELDAQINPLDNNFFQKIAEQTKKDCPVSRALAVPIILKAQAHA